MSAYLTGRSSEFLALLRVLAYLTRPGLGIECTEVALPGLLSGILSLLSPFLLMAPLGAFHLHGGLRFLDAPDNLSGHEKTLQTRSGKRPLSKGAGRVAILCAPYVAKSERATPHMKT
jgi:hypothetical protein